MNNINITFLQESKSPYVRRDIVLDERTCRFLYSINTKNRPSSKMRAEVNANAMASGDWCYDNPEGATFTVNASMTWLLDGQTRLEAIMQSRTFGHPAILNIVPDDKAEEVFKALNTGRVRTSGMTLSALGVANAKTVSAATRMLLVELEYNGTKNCMNSAYLNNAIIALLPIFKMLPLTRTHTGTGSKPSAEVVAGVLNAIRLDFLNVREAATFLVDALADNGEKTSPARQLSLLMVRIKSQGVRRMRPHELFACTTHLAMKQAQHAEVRLLKFGNGSEGTQMLIDRARVANPPIAHLFDIASRMNGNG